VSRGRQLAAACAALLASACASEEAAAPRSPPARDPTRGPAPAGCSLEARVEHEGASPALAPGAMALRDKNGRQVLLRLDEEGAAAETARRLDADSVAALAARADGWVALARTARGTELLLIGAPAESVRALRIGEQRLEEGALAMRGDRAFAGWIDDAGVLRAVSIDCLTDTVGEPIIVGEPSPRARVLASPTTLGAAIARSAPGPVVLMMTGEGHEELSAPGLPLGLLPRGERASVLHASPRATGLWLGEPGGAATCVSQPDARPEMPAIAPLPGGGAILVYRSGPDLFLQRVGPEGVPAGDPFVVDSALGEAPRARPHVATAGGRFWIAYETLDEDGPHVRVRAGSCE
jgi:hypothetical protein